MKKTYKLYILISLFIFSNNSLSQKNTTDKIVSKYSNVFKNQFYNNTIHKENYVLVEETGLSKLVIPFYFDKSTTKFNSDSLLKIRPFKLRKIEYIFYSNKNKNYQAKLNNARIDTLLSLYKNRFKNANGLKCSTIILSSTHSIKTQFTGFVITYEKSTKENYELMKSIINGDKDELNKGLFNLDTLSEYGYILPHYDENYKSDRRNAVWYVIARNEDWEKTMIVDLTGSMTPYISQYMLWLRLNYNRNEDQNYVFFNDGNDNLRRYGEKKIGKTGGIYAVNNKNGFEKIIQTIEKVMLNGHGGDIPENNIEALLYAEKKYPDAKNLIMVADNYATPRDMKLIKQLTKPVNVILCGVNGNNVNTNYMDLAFKTKGSLHTMEADLNELYKIKDGEEFEFMGKKYIITNDGVSLLNKPNVLQSNF